MLRFPLLQLAFGAAKKRRNLNRMGFNVGEPDGRLGPRTKEALMAFQHQKGFNATGEIDRETFAALRSEGG
jgi:localization factor PodJL